MRGLKYYNQLLDFGCFTLQDVQTIIQNKKTVESMLFQYVKRGWIRRIKKNYYVAMDLVNESPVCNRYEIAVKHHSSNYIAYHSALEYYAYNNQIFHEVVYCGEIKTTDFEFDGTSYHFVKSRSKIQIEEKYDGIRVTSLERTIVDCIDRMDLAGGIEEVYRALASIRHVDERKIIEILDAYDKKVLYQRAGYILENFKENLQICDSTFRYLHEKIGKSKCYLNSSKKIKDPLWNKKWNICVPRFVETLLSKGSEVSEF